MPAREYEFEERGDHYLEMHATVATAVVKGTLYLFEDTYGYALEDFTPSTDEASRLIAYIDESDQTRVQKDTGTGEIINVGDKVYFDFANTRFASATNGGAGWIYIGVCKEAAGATDETVLIHFTGKLWEVL